MFGCVSLLGANIRKVMGGGEVGHFLAAQYFFVPSGLKEFTLQ